MHFGSSRTIALTATEARSRNLAAVFEAIRDKGVVSRSEIAPAMPFSLQTVTNVTQELIAMGLIEEGGRLTTGRKGKPQVGLHIVPGQGHAVGLQIRWNSATFALVDLAYRVVDQVTVAMEHVEPRQYFDDLTTALGAFRIRHHDKKIWALSVSAPLTVGAGINPELLARQFEWGDKIWFDSFWKLFTPETLRATLAEAAGLPVIVLNNPQAAALAESVRQPPEARYVYIMLGLSLGAAFINARQLNYDLWRHAGELGYIVYKGETLNRFLSVSGLREALGMSQPQGLYEPLLEAALEERGPVIRRWYSDAAERLRLVINFIENAMRPDGIVLGGFIDKPYLAALIRCTEPLTNSVVAPSGDPQRVMSRLSVAQESAASIPAGAGICMLNSRSNPGFPGLLDARR